MVKARHPQSLGQTIRSDLERNIASGKWPPGYRIPFEHELMAQYQCSRMTVNRVLSLLAEKGLIERRRRVGSFVRKPSSTIESVALDIPHIPVDVALRGHVYSYRLLGRHVRKPAKAIPHELELAPKGSLIAVECLHLADDKPFALENRVINPVAVPVALEEPFTDQAPGTWLLQNIPWSRAEHHIRAINLGRAAAARLGVRVGTASLLIARRTWLGKTPITYVEQMFLGNSYDLVAHFRPIAR
jgi:GntR family histidine utilization transcriptional repressor